MKKSIKIFFFIVMFGSTACLSGCITWQKYIMAGKPFNVIFDKTAEKFDDSDYTGDSHTDPMGTLKGEESYTVAYKKGDWECTGFNQWLGRIGTFTYTNADIRENQISLWGRIYTFDDHGCVYDPDFGLVGRLSRNKKKFHLPK